MPRIASGLAIHPQRLRFMAGPHSACGFPGVDPAL
jgi:hypothetical protein